MNNIYLIAGKSGSGKDTIVNALCDKFGYKRLVSYTTRHKRNDPVDATSHIFVDIDDYFRDKENGRIVAETFYNGNYYWATKEQVDNSDLYIIDVSGIKSIKELYYNKPIIVVGIEADAPTRSKRMKLRGDSLTSIAARIDLDETEFKELPDLCDFTINNGMYMDGNSVSLNSAVQNLNDIILFLENQDNNRNILKKGVK